MVVVFVVFVVVVIVVVVIVVVLRESEIPPRANIKNTIKISALFI